MNIFLLNSDTFKRSFLEGDGQLELSSDQDIWLSLLATGGCFLPTVTRIAEVNFAIREGKSFKFGSAGGFNLKVGGKAGHQIRLIWPDEAQKVLGDAELAEAMTDEDVCLRLSLTAAADAGATASFPTGPISLGFGIQAGGSVGYEYSKIYNAGLTAKAILEDLFAGVRLPQQIESPTDAPADNEVIAVQYGGYLKLSSTLNWGYSLTGSRSIDFNDLSADLNYSLKAMAGLTIGYSLAGDFRVEARKGHADGWVRFTVRRNRDSQFNLAADFSLDGKHQLKGLPKSADGFLTAIIGADAASYLNWFQKARQYSSLDELEQALAPAIREFTHKWSQQLIGESLSDRTLNEFLNRAQTVSQLYQDTDQRILDLYHDYLDRIPVLNRVLEGLTAVTNPMELLTGDDGDDQNKQKEEWWELIQIVWGTNIYPLLLDNQEFNRFREFAGKVRSFIDDDATRPVRELIGSIRDFLPLDNLFKELGTIKSADELRKTVDLRIQDMAGRLIGKAFDEIGNSEWESAFKSVKTGLDRVEEFKNNWYEKVQRAVDGNFRFALHAGWSRAAQDRHLLDVELDLASEEGRRLARQASSGDFAAVLDSFNARFVRINKGVFTHSVTKSAQISVNVMGFGYDSLRQLTQSVEETIEETGGGLLHVYASETSLKRRRSSGRKFRETVESNLLLRSVGESLGGQNAGSESWLVRTLRELSIQYDFMRTDERTHPEELTRYLELAAFLGLIRDGDRPAFVADLQRQFPAGFGSVAVKYQIKYDDGAIRRVFESFDGDLLRRLARQTLRQVIASKYVGMKQTQWLARVGFAYLAPEIHATYEREGAPGLDKFRSVTLPQWYTHGAPVEAPLSKNDIAMLRTLCNLEKSYGNRIVDLAAMLNEAVRNGKPVALDKLKDAARNFVEMLDKLDDWRENAFFATLDKLIADLTGEKAVRQAVMILEITPPGGSKVTKVLMPQ